ncbi:MAG: T9SS type A sorting domain-containing protein [Bacteroidia bacterium]
MKNFQITLSLLCIFLFSSAQAQKYENAFILPGTETGKDVAELSDGSIVTVGISNSYGSGGNDMFVMKTNVSGALLWIRYFGGTGDDGGNTVVVTPENEIYAAGYKSTGTNKDGFIVKLNAAGSTLWTKTYGAGTSDEIRDGGYKSSRLYFVGATNGAGAGGSDAWFLKTDTAGTIIQNKTYGNAGTDVANACVFTADGNLAFGGQVSGYGDSTVYVVKVNLSGDSIWTRHYDLRGSTSNTTLASVKGIAELTTQELIVTGIGWDGSGYYSSTYHLKLNATGSTVFLRWTTLIADDGSDVAAGKNGTYYLFINYCNFGCRAYLAKYDNAGNQLLTAQYGYPGGSSYGNFTSGSRIRGISAGRLLLSGTSSLYNYNSDIWVARVDSNGVAYTTAAPVISAGGATTICSGNSVLLKAPAGYTNYSWGKMLQGNILFLNTDNDSVYATLSGTYFCVCWTGNSYRISNLITVTVNPSPVSTITVTGSKNFCAASGDSVVLSVPSAASTQYQWCLNNSAITGATANTYVAKTSGSYTVAVTNSCGTSVSTIVDVNASSAPNFMITCGGSCFSGPGSCGGGSSDLSVPTYNNVSYLWTVSGNPYFAGGPTVTPSIPGDYFCTITNACGTFPASSTYLINSYSSSNFVVGGSMDYSGPINGCGVGSSVTLYAPTGSTGPYIWYYGGVVIPGVASAGLTVSQSGGYSVTFYNPTCGMTMTTPVEAVVLNTPNPTLTAPNGNTACAGTVLLSASPSGNPGNMYEWYKDNVLIPGATASTYNASVSGWYKCRVYNPNCGWDFSNEQIVSIGAPAPVISATSNVICSTGSTTFSCKPNSTQAYSYQWYRNGVLIPSATAPYYITSAGGTIHCNLTNSCSTTSSATLPLIVKPTPVASIYTPASTLICTPQPVQLRAVGAPGANYAWYRNGGLVVSGADSVFSTATAGTYTVLVSDTSCNATSAGVILTSSTGPVATVTTSGYPQICSGEIYTLKAVSNAAYTYQWKKNGANIAGATDSLYGATATGTYSVAVTNTCGTILSGSYPLTVRTKPSAAITPSGPTTFCNGDSVTLQTTTGSGYTYYWKKNGNIITNAVASAYVAKLAGGYRAGVYSSYGCLKESGITTVTVPCREGDPSLPVQFDFTIFPNPSAGAAELILTGNRENEEVMLVLSDLTGRVIETNPVVNGNRILIHTEKAGVYFVTLMSGEAAVTKRFIRVD